MTEVRQVRVSYGPEGHGLLLAPVADDPKPGVADEAMDGVLRIGDGCVTLELPLPSGKTSMLAWDPVEVGLADVGLAAAG